MNWITKMFSTAPKPTSTQLPESAVILDVRSPAEFATGHVAEATNLPLDRFVDGYHSVAPDKSKPVVVYCASGARSAQAVQYLQQQGYTNVLNGISAQHVSRQYGKALA
jgi:phage shock protein E